MTSLRSLSDRELLQGCSRDDADAFGVFYVRYRERVLAYFSRRVRSPELAADLMAETFARALLAVREAKTGAVPESPVGWLLMIAKNQLVDSARRGSVEAAARRRLGLEPLVLDDRDIERIHEVAEASDLLEHAHESTRSPTARSRTAVALFRSGSSQAREPRDQPSEIRGWR